MTKTRLMVVVATCALGVAACGGDDGPPADAGAPDAAPFADASADAAPGTPQLGDLLVIEGRNYYDDGSGPAEHAYGNTAGLFYAGHQPSWHQETMHDASCRLREYMPAFCQAFCEGICTAPDVCEPWPALVAVGTITVTGLKVPAALAPDAYNYYFYPGGPAPAELFDSGDTIGMAAAGGAIPAFSAQAAGVARLETPISQTGKITLTPHQNHVITWTADPGAGADVRVRVTLNSNNQGHGAPYKAIIECDVPDAAGQVIVPSAMVDAFPETQAWTACAGSDCPPSWIRRYTRGSASAGGGEVGLVVGSQIEFGVDHTP